MNEIPLNDLLLYKKDVRLHYRNTLETVISSSFNTDNNKVLELRSNLIKLFLLYFKKFKHLFNF